MMKKTGMQMLTKATASKKTKKMPVSRGEKFVPAYAKVVKAVAKSPVKTIKKK